MDELISFVLARIAEIEAAAQRCAEMFPPPWEVADRGWRVRIYSANVPDEGDHAEPGDERAPVVMEVEPDRHIDDPLWLSERVEHILRHDPARVLAECKMRRHIVELAVAARSWADRNEMMNLPYEATAAAAVAYEEVVRSFAALDAAHPDYRQEWKP